MGGGEGGGMSFHTKYRVIDIEKGNRKIFDLTSKKKIKRPSLDSGIYFCIHLVKTIFHIIDFFKILSTKKSGFWRTLFSEIRR